MAIVDWSEMQEDMEQQPEVVLGGAPPSEGNESEPETPDAIESPAKVMRIGAMVRHLLEEVRVAPLDDKSRARMKEIYETSIEELRAVLSPELRDELNRVSSPFGDEVPSDAELRVAHAQLVGWLEGLFHGIQAMLFAQQMESRARLDQMRGRGLPPPQDQMPDTGQGTYL